MEKTKMWQTTIRVRGFIFVTNQIFSHLEHITKKIKLQPLNTYTEQKSTYSRQHVHTIQHSLHRHWAFMLPPRLRTVSFLKYHLLTLIVTQPITIVRILLKCAGSLPTFMLINTIYKYSTIHPRPVNITITDIPYEEQACQHGWWPTGGGE